MILATFDLQVTSILPMKFQVNHPFSSGEKVLNRFSTGLLGDLDTFFFLVGGVGETEHIYFLYTQSWISDQNIFTYF